MTSPTQFTATIATHNQATRQLMLEVPMAAFHGFSAADFATVAAPARPLPSSMGLRRSYMP